MCAVVYQRVAHVECRVLCSTVYIPVRRVDCQAAVLLSAGLSKAHGCYLWQDLTRRVNDRNPPDVFAMFPGSSCSRTVTMCVHATCNAQGIECQHAG